MGEPWWCPLSLWKWYLFPFKRRGILWPSPLNLFCTDLTQGQCALSPHFYFSHNLFLEDEAISIEYKFLQMKKFEAFKWCSIKINGGDDLGAHFSLTNGFIYRTGCILPNHSLDDPSSLWMDNEIKLDPASRIVGHTSSANQLSKSSVPGKTVTIITGFWSVSSRF